MSRTLSVLLSVALLLSVVTPEAVQQRNKDDDFAFQAFLFSLAARRTARTCERGLPDYRPRFDDLYKLWFTRQRERVARGESLFREALKKRDLSETERATLEQIERAIAELARPPRDVSPLELTESTIAMCAKILVELENGAKP